MKKVSSTIFAVALLVFISAPRAEDNDSAKPEHRPDVPCFENTESTCSDAIGPEEQEKQTCNLEILNKCEVVKSIEVFQKFKDIEVHEKFENPDNSDKVRVIGFASRAIFRVKERKTYTLLDELGQPVGDDYFREEDDFDGFLNAYFPDFSLLLAVRGLSYPFDADLDVTSKLAAAEVPTFEATIQEAEESALSKCEAAFEKYVKSVPTCDKL